MSHEQLLDLEPQSVSPVQEHLGVTATAGTRIEVETPDEGIAEQIKVQVGQQADEEVLDADLLNSRGQT